MPSYKDDPIIVRTTTPSGPENYNGGIYGESNLFNGLRGVTYAPGHGAVVGISENHTSQAGPGVFGQSDGTGVWGTSKTWMGVYGNTESTTGGAGVMGESTAGEGVRGVSHSAHGGVVGVNDWSGDGSPGSGGNGGWFESSQGEGVRGWSKNPNHGGVVGVNTGGGIAVYGTSDNSVGVWGTSVNFEGVHAETKSLTTAAIAAYNLNPNGTGAGIYAKKEGDTGVAGFFEGSVWVSKTLTVGVHIVLANADCAADFDIAGLEKAEPGTVMVLNSEGALRRSEQAYDKRVVGVISGAGSYKPGIVLDKQESSKNRQPIALMSKVYCKVDASYGAIEVGDLLTTSPTTGHAMKADDPMKAFGSVIGKALLPLASGEGLIPILIALQ
jgi:hypothetical protein